MLHRPHRRTIAISASLLSAALCVVAVACGEAEPPATPPAAPEPDPTDEAEAPEEPEEEPFVEHTLASGQTLWDVSRSYDVSLRRIMRFNGLTKRSVRRLSAGRVLRIPGVTEAVDVRPAGAPPAAEELPPIEDGAYHMLSDGETLWDLANVYDKTVDEIMERNGWSDDDVRALRSGQPVIIPGVEQSEIRTPRRRAGQRGLMHTVGSNESIWDIARHYRVAAAEVMAANGLRSEDVQDLREGRRLFIPGRGRAADPESQRQRPLTARQRRAQNRARLLGLGSVRAGRALLNGRVEARWLRALGGPRRYPGTLKWPVTNGRFVRGYGSGEGGYHLAVDIAGDIGWNVRSAAPGMVGYSGDGIRGYGNIVLVFHHGGWVTLYAHNSVNFVVAGERVRTGSVLAEVGSTGISRGPHVHFEFMAQGQNCDPAHLFRPGVRHQSRLANIARLEWVRPNRRPEQIRCHRRMRHPRSRWVSNESGE